MASISTGSCRPGLLRQNPAASLATIRESKAPTEARTSQKRDTGDLQTCGCRIDKMELIPALDRTICKSHETQYVASATAFSVTETADPVLYTERSSAVPRIVQGSADRTSRNTPGPPSLGSNWTFASILPSSDHLTDKQDRARHGRRAPRDPENSRGHSLRAAGVAERDATGGRGSHDRFKERARHADRVAQSWKKDKGIISVMEN